MTALEYWTIQVILAASLQACVRLETEVEQGNWPAASVARYIARKHCILQAQLRCHVRDRGLS